MEVFPTKSVASTIPGLEELMEQLLLKNREFDRSDVVYSRTYREQVSEIVDWMVSNDYEPDRSNGELLELMSLLASGQKRLRKFEEEYGKSWHSVCYPLHPRDICDCGPHLTHGYERFLKELQTVFGRLVFGKPGCHDVVCQESNDVPLLPSDVPLCLLGRTLLTRPLVAQTGKPAVFDSSRCEYVLVLCINAPVIFESVAFQSLLNLCTELSSNRRGVLMVMVARMNILADSKEVFDHLFSGFPSSCLAVPYEDWKQRERIWKLLSCVDKLQGCVVYTKGLCVKSFHADGYRGFPYGASEFPFGAEAFPFTEEMVQKVQEERVQLREDSLENLLRPYECSSDVFVLEFNSTADGPQKERPQRISEVMKKKHVGLYVCCKGSLIPLLDYWYKECKSKGQKFEIVVLYLPLLSGIDPDIFVKKIDGLLQKHKICGWWSLPFNNSVSLRLWGLTMGYDIGDLHLNEDTDDRLIIVGPEGKILDMYGAQIMKRVYVDGFGIDIYPFTRAAVVKKKVLKVKNLKLESLLAGQLFRGDDPSDVISADTLLSSKKKIIVYMGRPNEYIVNCLEYDFPGLVSQYKEMKKSSDDFEVVFIEYKHLGKGAENAEEFGSMPWYTYSPLDGTYTSLATELTKLVQVQSLVGFGEDGRICSVKLLEELDKSDTPGLCLEDTLHDDLHLLCRFDEYADI